MHTSETCLGAAVSQWGPWEQRLRLNSSPRCKGGSGGAHPLPWGRGPGERAQRCCSAAPAPPASSQTDPRRTGTRTEPPGRSWAPGAPGGGGPRSLGAVGLARRATARPGRAPLGVAVSAESGASATRPTLALRVRSAGGSRLRNNAAAPPAVGRPVSAPARGGRGARGARARRRVLRRSLARTPGSPPAGRPQRLGRGQPTAGPAGVAQAPPPPPGARPRVPPPWAARPRRDLPRAHAAILPPPRSQNGLPAPPLPPEPRRGATAVGLPAPSRRPGPAPGVRPAPCGRALSRRPRNVRARKGRLLAQARAPLRPPGLGGSPRFPEPREWGRGPRPGASRTGGRGAGPAQGRGSGRCAPRAPAGRRRQGPGVHTAAAEAGSRAAVYLAPTVCSAPTVPNCIAKRKPAGALLTPLHRRWVGREMTLDPGLGKRVAFLLTRVEHDGSTEPILGAEAGAGRQLPLPHPSSGHSPSSGAPSR